MAGELFTRLWKKSEEDQQRRDAQEGRGGSVGAGAGGAILLLPFYGPYVAFFLYPLTLVGIAVSQFLCNQLRYSGGILPEEVPAWQYVVMFAAGYACFRVDDRLGLRQPYYFIRHGYRIGLAVVLFIVAGVRQISGTSFWPGVLELFAEASQILFMFVAVSVYAVVGNRLLRSDGLRSVWNFVLKTWHIRPQDFPVLYKRGDPSFRPFTFRDVRREPQKPKDIVDEVLSRYIDLDTGQPLRAQKLPEVRDEARSSQ